MRTIYPDQHQPTLRSSSPIPVSAPDRIALIPDFIDIHAKDGSCILHLHSLDYAMPSLGTCAARTSTFNHVLLVSPGLAKVFKYIKTTRVLYPFVPFPFFDTRSVDAMYFCEP